MYQINTRYYNQVLIVDAISTFYELNYADAKMVLICRDTLGHRVHITTNIEKFRKSDKVPDRYLKLIYSTVYNLFYYKRAPNKEEYLEEQKGRLDKNFVIVCDFYFYYDYRKQMYLGNRLKINKNLANSFISQLDEYDKASIHSLSHQYSTIDNSPNYVKEIVGKSDMLFSMFEGVENPPREEVENLLKLMC